MDWLLILIILFVLFWSIPAFIRIYAVINLYIRIKKIGLIYKNMGLVFHNSFLPMVIIFGFNFYLASKFSLNLTIILPVMIIIFVVMYLYLALQPKTIREKGITSPNGAWYWEEIESFKWEKDKNGVKRILVFKIMQPDLMNWINRSQNRRNLNKPDEVGKDSTEYKEKWKIDSREIENVEVLLNHYLPNKELTQTTDIT